jgi:hypothetical protein
MENSLEVSAGKHARKQPDISDSDIAYRSEVDPMEQNPPDANFQLLHAWFTNLHGEVRRCRCARVVQIVQRPARAIREDASHGLSTVLGLTDYPRYAGLSLAARRMGQKFDVAALKVPMHDFGPGTCS